MSHTEFRIQFVSDKEGIDALCQAAAAESVATEGPRDVEKSDQPLDWETVKEIVVNLPHNPAMQFVAPAIQVAALLRSSFQWLHGKKKITIKTPLTSTTIEVDRSMSDEVLLKLIEKAGIFPK
jgi:hypothetical protein